MLIACFAERRFAGKHNDRFTEFKACENGAHADMRDNNVSAFKKFRGFIRRHKRCVLKATEINRRPAVLKVNIAGSLRTSPRRYWGNEAIKRKL